MTVETGPYTSPLNIETLEGPTTSGNGSDTNTTIDGSGESENSTAPVNETSVSTSGDRVAIIAGSLW